jgi:hypothetical protein
MVINLGKQEEWMDEKGRKPFTRKILGFALLNVKEMKLRENYEYKLHT